MKFKRFFIWLFNTILWVSPGLLMVRQGEVAPIFGIVGIIVGLISFFRFSVLSMPKEDEKEGVFKRFGRFLGVEDKNVFYAKLKKADFATMGILFLYMIAVVAVADML